MSDPQLEAIWSTNLLFFLIILKVFLEGKRPMSMWGMMYHGNHLGFPKDWIGCYGRLVIKAWITH